MKVYIVESNSLAREALKLFLERDLNCTVIGESGSGKQCLEDKHIYKADIVLIDCEMPEMNGYEITKKITSNRFNLRVIGMTMHIDKVYLTKMLQAGFSGCVDKIDIFQKLKITMEHVSKGQIYFPDEIEV